MIFRAEPGDQIDHVGPVSVIRKEVHLLIGRCQPRIVQTVLAALELLHLDHLFELESACGWSANFGPRPFR